MAVPNKHVAITPDNDADISVEALWIGGAGDVRCADMDGNIVIYTKPADSYILCGITKVFATGTTATNLVGYNF